MSKARRLRVVAGFLVVLLLFSSCGGPAKPTPDGVATRVAETLAAATLAAGVPNVSETPAATRIHTATSTATPTPTASSPSLFPASAEAVRGSRKTTIAELAIEVLATRAWTDPEQKFELIGELPSDNYYFWQMDDVPVGTGYVVMDKVGAGETLRVLSTGATFTKEVIELPASQGRFLEVLLLFENTSNTTLRQVFSSKGSFLPYVRLVLPDGREILPVDFLIPSNHDELSRYRELQRRGLTIVCSYTGTMQVYLEPAGQTWLLLLFDIAQATGSAELRLIEATPIVLELK